MNPMFLQTIVHLHILLAATPALAGWTLLMPADQVLPAHVYCVVSRSAAGDVSDVPGLHARMIVMRRAQPGAALRLSSNHQSQDCVAQTFACVRAIPLTQNWQHFPRAARAP
jgi:hypothetical protein